MISDEAIREHDYLIARGTRSLALLGQCASDPDEMLGVSTRLERSSSGISIPFVLDRGNGVADFGFATHKWVVDLYKFITRERSPVPQGQRDRILGLLLGYSAEAIAHFDDRSSESIVSTQQLVNASDE